MNSNIIAPLLKNLTFLFFIAIVSNHTHSAGSDKQLSPRTFALNVGVKVPLRDNIELNATVYRPIPIESPLPVILHVTPYISDSYHDDAKYFAKKGFIYILVDSRGRGSSGGVLNPMFQEANDVYDVMSWIVGQPWSNGKVGMRGGSYSGHNQWAGAKLRPKGLVSIVPAAAPFVGYDWPRKNNIQIDISWDVLTRGATANRNLGGDLLNWKRTLRSLYSSGKSYSELYEYLNSPSTVFSDWVRRETLDDWHAANPTNEEFSKIDIPIFTVTGYYDSVQKGALEMYRRHTQYASISAAKKHFVIIGPWGHSETRNPKASLGGLSFGNNSVIDMKALDAEWYDWTLNGGERPGFLKDQVSYFVAGANKWKYAKSLDSIANKKIKYYLNSNGKADSLYAGATLQTESVANSSPDSYTYDPADLPEDDTPLPWYWVHDLANQPHINALDGNGVVYHSSQFTESIEITGNIRFDAWMSLNVPDTDFVVSVYEVMNDGTSVLLAADMKRARFRYSLNNERLVKPGKIEKYTFDTFNFFSRKISKGSRIRLVVMGQHSIIIERNFNTGGTVSKETIHESRPAKVTLYHNNDYPSALTLPVVD